MADVLEEARASIEGRLKELEREAARLRDALAGMTRGRAATSAGARTGTAKRTRRSSGQRRAPRGQREAQFLAAVKKKPGSKVPEIAKEMGVTSNQAYGLGKRLQTQGKVTRRRGGGYAVKAGSK